MLVGHVADQLHDQHRLAHAGAAEQTDLAALGVGGQQVYHLDAGFQHLVRRHNVGEGRGALVDGLALFGLYRALAVDGLAHHVEHAAQGLLAHRHLDGGAGGGHRAAPGKAVGGAEGDAAHGAAAQLLHHFRGDGALSAFQADRVIDGRQLPLREAHVHYRAHYLTYRSFFHPNLHSAERSLRPPLLISPWLSWPAVCG